MTALDYADNTAPATHTTPEAPHQINAAIDAIGYGTLIGFCFRAIIAFHIALLGIACVVFGFAALIAAIFMS